MNPAIENMHQETIDQASRSNTLNPAIGNMHQETIDQASRSNTLNPAFGNMHQETIDQASRSNTLNPAFGNMHQETIDQASRSNTLNPAFGNMHQETIGQASRSRTPSSMIGKVTSFLGSSRITGVTSVLLVGNPGVGKSTILSALGGDFKSGYSGVSGMTKRVSTQKVDLQGRQLRLTDMPGIYDATEGKDDVITEYLRMLRDTLNDGSDYVVFFVVTPRNGRIDPGDLIIMKLLLDNMKDGPLVGLILTQVRNRDYAAVQSKGYFSQVQGVLANGDTNLKFLEKRRALVLRDHDTQFSEQELHDIRDYVLAFQPKRVTVHDMVAGIVRTYLEMLKRIFS